jgi:integrase
VHNLRRRVVGPAVKRASEALTKAGAEPLPDKITPHSLRRTYASILYALGEAPPYVMAQMGHTDPSLALAIYARVMDRRDGEPERLAALVGRRASGQPDPYRAITGNGTPQGTPGVGRGGRVAA